MNTKRRSPLPEAADLKQHLHRCVDLLSERAGPKESILEIDCGDGSALARLRVGFDRVFGADPGIENVRASRARNEGAGIEHSSALQLGHSILQQQRFDAIVFGGLDRLPAEHDKERVLTWISAHLRDDGVALLTAQCSGGRYLTPTELRDLLRRQFAIEHEELLDGEHALVVCRRRRRFACLTVSHPPLLPADGEIDWASDVLEPTERLLDICDAAGVPVTLMADMGLYFWLRASDGDAAAALADQWRDAVSRGHDVQPHLVAASLRPSAPQRRTDDWRQGGATALGDGRSLEGVDALIAETSSTLHEVFKGVCRGHSVTAVRVSDVADWSFRQVVDALTRCGIFCDTSVPGRSSKRGGTRDLPSVFSYSSHQPYFASRSDPHLKAPPAEREIIELPLACLSRDDPWSLDWAEGARFADRLLEHLSPRPRPSTISSRRRLGLVRRLAAGVYLRSPRRLANRVIPPRLAQKLIEHPPDDLVGDDYFVLSCRLPSVIDVDPAGTGISRLRDAGVEFLTLSAMAERARDALERATAVGPLAEHERQIHHNYANVMSTERNVLQSSYLQRLVPAGVRRLLDLGCGAGDWSRRIADDHPGCEVVGVDIGEDFIERAQGLYGDDRVTFVVEDFAGLSFSDATFDCIYADNSLEHAYDVDATLREACRVLALGGTLVAAIPSDARNPTSPNASHTWKTEPEDVRARLVHAGFRDITIEEINVYRRFRMTPYAPSNDLVMFVSARRQAAE